MSISTIIEMNIDLMGICQTLYKKW